MSQVSRFKIHTLLGFTAPIALIAAPAAAIAQTASDTDEAAAAREGGLGDIIVTAQKRAENVQDVPIAITALNTGRLENTAASISTTNLQQFVPGLVMGRSGTSGATFLRGVGTEAGTAGVESPVATYLGDIYLGVNALGVFELNNIEQVSVLKGPQGTLFGRNATGGAIQITTKNPSLAKSEVKVELGYGNYDTVTTRLYASTPITDTLAANVAVLYKNRGEGTIRNLFTGNDLQAERVFTAQTKVLWQPTDETRVLLSVIHSEGEDLPGVNYFVQKGALSQDGQTEWAGPYNVNLHIDPTQNVKATIGALRVTHDFGAFRVSNLISRTEYQNRAFNDQSMTTAAGNPGGVVPRAANLNADISEWSNELQFLSAEGQPLTWVVGLFYFNDKTDTSLRNYNYVGGVRSTLSFGLDTQMRTDSYAAYGQATYEILPNTNLTGGLRFTRDEKGFSGTTVSGGTVSPNLPPQARFDKLTWRIALDHKFSDDIMGYASYNRGFRGGTYSATSLTNPAARPETLDAYELGLKSELFDRKLRLNIAGFYYDYKDLQLRQNIALEGAATTALIVNAAKARIYGIDVDFETRPVQNLRLFGGFEAMKAEYVSFPNGPANFPVGVDQIGLDAISAVPAGCSGSIRPGTLVGGHSNNIFCDLSGNDMINAPRFSATLGAELTVPTSKGELLLSVADKFTGKSYASPDNFQVLESYHYVTASLGWISTDEHYFAKLWTTNLTKNKRPAQLAYSLNTYEFLPNEPRFYGVTFGFKY